MSNDGLIKNGSVDSHHGRYIVEMKLFFVILTHPLNEPIPINISKENIINNQQIHKDKLTFGDLKSYIWNIIKNREDDSNNGYSMKLWKVEDLEEGKEKWKELETLASSYTETDIENFGGNKLLSTNNVLKDFQGVSENRVHILVQPPSSPATTGKRRLEDSDEGNQAKKKMRQYPAESKEGRDSLLSISGNRLDSIVKFVERNRVSLLRSPPSSGKTTLGQTLRDYFINRSVYISLAGLGGKDQISEKVFEDFWRNEIGYSWAEINDRTETIYVFIDEIQVIYGDRANYFWSKVKMLMSSECEKDIHILLFGTYDPILMDETTPVKFSDNNTLNLKALLLTKEELKDLLRFYVRMRVLEGNTLFKITKEIEDTIFSLTKGHVGLCRFILDSLYTRYKDKSNHFLAEQSEEALTLGMLRYLASPSLSINVMKGSRAFYWIDSWSPTDREAKFIRNVLLDNSSFPVDYSTDNVAKNFIRTGLFVVDSGQVQFTAPIFRIVLSHHLFTSPLTKEPTPNFEEFLKRTIERMSPSTLTTSYGRGKGSCLLERSWQMEWYRTATTVAPKNTSVSPDVGAIFGANGFLDFFVNSDYCWGIELTREGNCLKEHAERFVNGGKYDRIPMKNWAIIDFRCYQKEVRELKTNFWYVLYANDYKSVTIKRSGQQDEVLFLKGDNV